MKLAILHHHLNRGGVSQVVQNHLRALATLPLRNRPEQVLLVYDGQRDGWPEQPLVAHDALPVEWATLSQIGYDSRDSQLDPLGLASSIEQVLELHGCSANDTVLHTHNPTLGKNASLPGALARLAEQEWKQLLQIHDFAEDNRPENYHRVADPSALYPQAAHVHYATLSSRDASVLCAAGLDESRLHTLPNPVAEFGDLPDSQPARSRVLPALQVADDARLIVYPVRGIRRKNLGEMLLLAALAPEGAVLVVTLAPKNPAESKSFDRWQGLSEELGLPCRFDAAVRYGVDFHDLLSACDAVLTTSVAEGFGMVFLEAWLADRPLMGRNLPDLTKDFVQQGVCFDGLYAGLRIPGQLLAQQDIKRDAAQRYLDACAEYGIAPRSEAAVSRDIDRLFAGGCFDFGRLTPDMQASVIRQAVREPQAREDILHANDGLFCFGRDAADAIRQNSAAVREAYSVERIGGQLQQAYRAVLNAAPGAGQDDRFDSSAVLRHFVTPTNLYPVRTES